MPCEGNSYCDLSRFIIPDFSDHHDIRVVAQHRPEGIREGEIYLRLDLDLRYPLELIFNRVFYRYYFIPFLLFRALYHSSYNL